MAANNMAPSGIDKEQVAIIFLLGLCVCVCFYSLLENLIANVISSLSFYFWGVIWSLPFARFWMRLNDLFGNGADIWNGWKGDGV